MSQRDKRGKTESGKFGLKWNFQKDPVFEDDKTQGVSNRVGMQASLELRKRRSLEPSMNSAWLLR